ncbi:MAG: anaerobic ribonucleoside-triphosphate reductase activating protein [Clostridiales bacterium]|nr:anaerobic ribonucleoside-triphosphate reductase activating protein [Clostridiales bacterium]
METKLRLAGVIRESIVDGPGWRLVVFAQGCPHNCNGCQNPQTHNFIDGYDSTVENILNAVKENPLLSGITLSGGEPFSQAKHLAVLAREVHSIGLNVMAYTGWSFEQLYAGANEQNGWLELLSEVDWLVDGKFEIENKTLSLKFRGSSNQRIIDVKKSLSNGLAVEIEL